MPENEKPFSVLTTYRPRRVAFLVDPTYGQFDLVLDAIADFSCDTWGGSYNPIIPVIDGRVSMSFWPLLQAADPDIIYSYAKVEESEIRSLNSSFIPTRMIPHHYGGGERQHAVWIQGQASIAEEILKLQKGPGKKRRVVTWSPSVESDRFICRNFGTSRVAYAIADHEYLASFAGISSRTDLCSGITQGFLVSPRFLSSLVPVKKEFATGAMHFFEFLICYGDSGWNFVHFWNEAYRHGFPDRQISHWLEEVWIPNEMAAQDKIQPLIQLIEPRFHHMPGDHPLMIRIVSYDHTEAQIRALAGLIDNIFGSRVSFETAVCEPGFFPGGQLVPHRPMKANLPQHDHVRGSFFFITPAEKAEGGGGDEVWMADVQIQVTDEGVLENNWWTFPRRSKIASLLHSTTPSRIVEGGTLSVEVSNRTQKIEITLPNDRELFTALLTPEIRYSTTTDLRYPLLECPRETVIRISDKGKYMNGLVGLFPSLADAGYLMELPFWRELLVEYSSPRNSEQGLAKLRKDIAKSAEDFIKQYDTDKDEAITGLAERTLRSLRNIPQIREAFTFKNLTKRWENYLAKLGPDEGALADANSISETLSMLSNTMVLLQGCRVRCEQCLSVYWYHIDDLRAEFPCHGCRKQVKLPVELPWSYQLNDLVRTAIREHGTGPVLRTSYLLMIDSKAFFRLLVGAELHDIVDQGTQLIGELDICWVSDGRFGIAEVKTSAKDFTASECERIVNLAKRVLPDDVLIAAVEGSDTTIESARSTIEQRLGGVTVRCFLPKSFSNVRHHRRAGRPGKAPSVPD